MDKKPEAKPNSLEPLHDASMMWRHIAPAGVTLEMCQRPDYWRNVVRECGQQRQPNRHAWNKIEILSEDGTWEADLRVLSAADGLVQTRLLRHWKAEGKVGRKPSVPDGYVVEHVAGNGWRALDDKGAIVGAHMTTEDEAVRCAAAHAKRKESD